jgi:hypothetical protein
MKQACNDAMELLTQLRWCDEAIIWKNIWEPVKK